MKLNFLKQGIQLDILMIVIVLTIFSLSSCDKEGITTNNPTDNPTDNSTDNPIPNDNYYVKYVISCSYPYIFSNWSVSTPDGQYTKNNYQTRRWEETYGPVKKGFKCNAKVENGRPNINIYVSKNNEPFALRATKTEVGSVSYTINF